MGGVTLQFLQLCFVSIIEISVVPVLTKHEMALTIHLEPKPSHPPRMALRGRTELSTQIHVTERGEPVKK